MLTPEGEKYNKTVYSSCCNVDRGIYYYTTYEHRHIVGVDMNREELDGECLASYPLKYENDIDIIN
jgi:choloylglycine hydrolase